MKIMNRVGWILVGVLVGVLATTSLRAVGGLQEQPSARLVVLRATIADGYPAAYFIKDTRGGGCWLVLPSRDDITRAVAPAPESACYER